MKNILLCWYSIMMPSLTALWFLTHDEIKGDNEIKGDFPPDYYNMIVEIF